jgi:hypothetical protein
MLVDISCLGVLIICVQQYVCQSCSIVLLPASRNHICRSIRGPDTRKFAYLLRSSIFRICRVCVCSELVRYTLAVRPGPLTVISVETKGSEAKKACLYSIFADALT